MFFFLYLNLSSDKAYSENTIEELRDLKEKGGIDLAGIINYRSFEM